MAESVEAGAKAGFKALKTHWMFFAGVAVLIAVLVLAYDYRNKGTATAKVMKWPIVGGWFKQPTAPTA